MAKEGCEDGCEWMELDGHTCVARPLLVNDYTGLGHEQGQTESWQLIFHSCPISLRAHLLLLTGPNSFCFQNPCYQLVL